MIVGAGMKIGKDIFQVHGWFSSGGHFNPPLVRYMDRQISGGILLSCSRMLIGYRALGLSCGYDELINRLRCCRV